MITQGNWCGERVTNSDGDDAICVWQPIGDQEVGYVIDFSPADIDDLIAMLQVLKTIEATEIELEVEVDDDSWDDGSEVSTESVSSEQSDDEEGYGHGV